MRTKSTILLLVALALALVPAVFAGRAEPVPQDAAAPHHRMLWLHAKRHEVTGKIESLTASRLTLGCQAEGERQVMSFALDPETQREGTVAAGKQATVRFRVENNRKIATFVTVHDDISASAKSAGAKR